MRSLLCAALLGCLSLAADAQVGAAAPRLDGLTRIAVQSFVTLPDDVRHPEGLSANPRNGDIYVGTFDARQPASERNNQLLRYSAQGRLIARYRLGPTPVTGIEYLDGKLYLLNFGASRLQRLDGEFTEASPLEDLVSFTPLKPATVPPRLVDNPDGSQDRIVHGASGFPAINGMVFDADHNLYISDSFQGAIYRIDGATTCSPCTVTVVSRDPLLATSGHPPFGANGLAFGKTPDVLYVNNAGDHRLLKLHLPTGRVSVLTESLPGADGLMFHDGLLWVTANQADTVFGIDESGLIRVRAGEFLAIEADGSPRGLLFPASTAVSGRYMVITNLALPLTPVVGDEWEERVTRWNLVRFKLP